MVQALTNALFTADERPARHSSAPPRVEREREVVVPLPVAREHMKPATHWRSTWIVSSIQALRERGHFARYESLLSRTHRTEVLFTVAGVWLPMRVARAHYLACDALGLSRQENSEIGAACGERAHKSLLSTGARLARTAGVTPWTIVPFMQRLWERGTDGGGGAVYRVGPKESVVEMVGCELFDIPYFRVGYAAVLLGLVKLFCERAYVHDVTRTGAQGECALRFQWV